MAESITIQRPAPIGGINATLPEFGLPPINAVELVNLVPYGGMLCPRLPFSVKLDSNNIATLPRWLFTYAGTSGELLVIVAEDGTGYILNPDLTLNDAAGGVAGIEQCVGFNFDGKFAFTGYPTNGPRQYEPTGGAGTISLTMPVIGEWSTADLEQITGGHPFKNRVYWWSEDFRSIVYTAVNAIGGQLEYFPLSTVAQTGGTVRCVTSLTMDGGSGPDDYLAIVLTTGEAIIYQGSDPGDSNDWSLVGRFVVPPPVHAGATQRIGGDVLMLTRQGLIPLQQYSKAMLGQVRIDWLDAINPILRDELNDQRAPVGMNASLAYLPTRRWTVAITGPVVANLGFLTDSLFGSCRAFIGDSAAWTTFEIRVPVTVTPGLDFPDIDLRNSRYCLGILAMAEANGTTYALVRTLDDDEDDRPRLVAYEIGAGMPVLNDPSNAPIRCGYQSGWLPMEPDAVVREAQIAWSRPVDGVTEIRRWYYRGAFNFGTSSVNWSALDANADIQDVATRGFGVNGKGSAYQETVIFDFAYTDLASERAIRLYKTEVRVEATT